MTSFFTWTSLTSAKFIINMSRSEGRPLEEGHSKETHKEIIVCIFFCYENSQIIFTWAGHIIMHLPFYLTHFQNNRL